MGCSFVAGVVRRVAVLAALALTGASHAATITLSQFAPNPGVLPGGGWEFTSGTTFANPPAQRAWVNGVYGSVPKVVATDALTLAAKGGPLAVQVAQRVGIAEAAGAVARCLAGSAPVCGAVTAAALLYEGYRIFRPADHAGSPACAGAELCADPGQPQSSQTVDAFWAASSFGAAHSGCSGKLSHRAAAECVVANLNASNYNDALPNSWTDYTGVTLLQDSGSVQYWNVQLSTCNKYTNPVQTICTASTFTNGIQTTKSGTVTQNTCPASVDFSNPAYSVPAGEAPGPDGKCRTARYNHQPMTAVDAAARLQQYPPSDPGAALREPLQRAVENGQEVPAEVEVSGPASQTGSPVSTTTTNGQGTTTTTQVPTYNYHYDGARITYDTVNNTYSCVGAGACSSSNATSTTTTTTPAATDPTQDPEDPCAKSPDRLGCMKLGTAPTEQIPKVTRDVSFASESLGLAEGCPAPVSLPNGKQISYQGLCDGLTMVRPLIIAIGFMLAGGIVVAALRN